MKAPPAASIKDADDGGEVVAARAGRARAAVPAQFARAASAITCCRATRSTSPATPSRGRAAAAAAAGRKAARTARARTISASPCRATNSSTCSWKTWNCPIWRSARSSDAEAVTWQRAGYSVSGSPANLALNAHGAEQPVAAHRAAAAEARGDCRRCATRSPRSDDAEDDAHARRAARPNSTRKQRRTGADPLHRSARRALQALRAACRSRSPRR